jgi:hypothetical protein
MHGFGGGKYRSVEADVGRSMRTAREKRRRRPRACGWVDKSFRAPAEMPLPYVLLKTSSISTIRAPSAHTLPDTEQDRLARRGRTSASPSRLSRDAPPLRGLDRLSLPRQRLAKRSWFTMSEPLLSRSATGTAAAAWGLIWGPERHQSHIYM